jgi:hypothetical protein
MSEVIHAVFDSGVFRPLEPVDLPEGAQVDVIVPAVLSPSTEHATGPSSWPDGYFEQTAGALAGEEIQRPPQGELPTRDDW